MQTRGSPLCILDIPVEGTLFRCESSTQRPDIRLCDQSFDLMDCLDLLWDEGENIIFSVDDSPGVFPRNWLPPQLYYIRAYWRLPEFALMQLSGVCFMQVNRCFSVWNR